MAIIKRQPHSAIFVQATIASVLQSPFTLLTKSEPLTAVVFPTKTQHSPRSLISEDSPICEFLRRLLIGVCFFTNDPTLAIRGGSHKKKRPRMERGTGLRNPFLASTSAAANGA